MLALVRDIGRLREISTVLFRHGFGEIATRAGLLHGPPDAAAVTQHANATMGSTTGC